MEDDFDNSLAKLLNGGYDTNPNPEQPDPLPALYDLEPMPKERDAILKLFFEKFAEHLAKKQLNDIGDFFNNSSDEYMPEVSIADEAESNEDALLDIVLNEQLAEIIKKYPYMTEGEMHVHGDGIYMTHRDDNRGIEVAGFFEGKSIIGKIKTYEAAPVISYEDFLAIQEAKRGGDEVHDAMITMVPGVWLVMEDVSLIDQAGRVEVQYGTLKAPLNYLGLKFSKVYYQYNPELQDDDTEQYVDVAAHFMGDLTLELFENFEDELNYKTSKKNLPETLESIQKAIDEYMKIIDRTNDIEVSGLAGWTATEEVIELNKAKVKYVRTKPQLNDGMWSIVHEFIINREERGSVETFVLPAHIQTVEYFKEK